MRPKRAAEASLGREDLQRIRRLDILSRAMEIVGRGLIHGSVEPISFTTGIIALWIHKQIQATEIGHAVLHGAYDHLDGAGRFHSSMFSWDIPIDEASWRHGHNVRHHGNTNIAGKDPDIHFGPVRLTEHTPHKKHHFYQLPYTLFILFPNFAFMMNMHFTGLGDAYLGNGRAEGLDFLPERSLKAVLFAHGRALRKYIPYYLKNYAFFPLLAGPMFWKVLFGNWLAETLRDIYTAAVLHCGHVGADVTTYAEGTKARSRGEWFAMQVEATNNFDVSLPVSILCGGLDRHIEHHLFPRLPPGRLREVAPQVRAICEAHGVSYETDSWGRTLKKAFARVAALSRDEPEGPGVGARATLREMARLHRRAERLRQGSALRPLQDLCERAWR